MPNTTIQHIYKNGRAVEDNWIATGSHKGQVLAPMLMVNLVVILTLTALAVSPLETRAKAASMHLQKTALARSILTSKSMLLPLRMQIMLCWLMSSTSLIRTFVRLARITRRCATLWHSTPVSFLFRRPILRMQPSLRMVSGISMLAAIWQLQEEQ